MQKLLIAALVGALLLFGWAAVSRTATPLGHTGISVLPKDADEALIATLRDEVKEPGFYFFPRVENYPKATDPDQEAWDKQAQSGPQGVLVVQPLGDGTSHFGTTLMHEAMLSFVCALIMAVILRHVPASMGYFRRVGIATLIGLYGALDIEGSNHLFWHFPTAYYGAQVVIATVGALCAGLAVAAIVDAPE